MQCYEQNGGGESPWAQHPHTWHRTFFPVQGFRKFSFHGVLFKTNMKIDFCTIIQTRGHVTTGKYDTI